MEWRSLNLAAIEAALPGMIGIEGRRAGETITGEVIDHMTAGYAYVDSLLRGRVDVFAYGETHHILELNHRVLCGVSAAVRDEFRDHIEATERWFYDKPDAGIAAVADWYGRNRTREPVALAAGLLVEVVAAPQLFIEGNRRTATLLASYVLARGGQPPLVPPPAEFPQFDALSRHARRLDRAGFTDGVMARFIAHRLAAYIRETGDPGLLAPRAAAPASRPNLSAPQTG